MAIKFAAKHDAKGAVATPPSPVGTAAAVGVEASDTNGSDGALIETVASPAIGADLFDAAPAASRKRRKKK